MWPIWDIHQIHTRPETEPTQSEELFVVPSDPELLLCPQETMTNLQGMKAVSISKNTLTITVIVQSHHSDICANLTK